MATSLSSIDEAIGKLISFDVNDANGTKVCKIAVKYIDFLTFSKITF